MFYLLAPLGLGHHVGLITRLGVLNFCQLAWILSVPSMAPVSGPTSSGYGFVCLRPLFALRSTLVATVSVLVTSVIGDAAVWIAICFH